MAQKDYKRDKHKILPEGCIFADKGPVAFADNDEQQALLALMNSQAFEALVALQLGAADAAARSYEVGLIQKVPVPNRNCLASLLPLEDKSPKGVERQEKIW